MSWLNPLAIVPLSVERQEFSRGIQGGFQEIRVQCVSCIVYDPDDEYTVWVSATDIELSHRQHSLATRDVKPYIQNEENSVNSKIQPWV